MFDLITITKALADENRVRLFMALKDRELCVCQLIELIELAPSTVSKHMSILKQARLVESRKNGRWIYYRLPRQDATPQIQAAIDWVSDSLARDRRIRNDNSRLEQILKIDPEELCKRQGKG